MTANLTLENLDTELAKVPMLPATVTNVLCALQRNEVNLVEVEQHLSKDPGLTMRVLRIANSPFYGLGGRIDNIKDACIVLGVHTTRNIWQPALSTIWLAVVNPTV